MLLRRFRWVYCQLEVLRHCFQGSVRRILDELPKSLDETYERILKEINSANKEHAYRLLQCLVVVTRPLRVKELADVLAFDFTSGGIPELNADWRWEDQEEAVLSACSSLVSVIIVRCSRIVQFSHFSVKEFLTSDRLARSTEEVSSFHIPIEPSHMILAQACLGVLLRLDGREDKDSIKNIPLARYATEYWLGHARVGDVELQIKDSMDPLFDAEKPHFWAWVRIRNVDDDRSRNPFYLWKSDHTLNLASPLYFAALCGFHGQVERLINKHPQHINSQAGFHGTPFHATVYNGHIEVAKLLSQSQHGADVNAISTGKKRTPFLLASYSGHLAIAKWLLDCSAVVNCQDGDGLTPLHVAAANGHLDIVRLLLAQNMEVNSRNNDRYTPLLLALEYGHIDVVQLLLDHKADPNIHSDDGRTPLHFAAWRGYLDISRKLLERSAEVDARDKHRFTPLLLASQYGHIDVVQSLLDHNADPNVHSNIGRTPLHFAASNGHLDISQKLLECHVEVDARDQRQFTPLILALEYGHIDVVQLLLDHNADLNVHRDGRTPLHFAA